MFFDTISAYINLIERIIEFVEKRERKRKIANAPLGDTLTKVESAHKHLTDAIEAIDLIRDRAISERTHLDGLLQEVERKRKEYNEASSSLETTKGLLQMDQDKLRSSLNFNSAREKMIGFISGVLASILATAAWVFAPKVWCWVQSFLP